MKAFEAKWFKYYPADTADGAGHYNWAATVTITARNKGAAMDKARKQFAATTFDVVSVRPMRSSNVAAHER